MRYRHALLNCAFALAGSAIAQVSSIVFANLQENGLPRECVPGQEIRGICLVDFPEPVPRVMILSGQLLMAGALLWRRTP